MKKLIAAFCVLAGVHGSAQTLFYYGQDSVSVNTFLNAYHKNNTGPRSAKALREYLDLYIASRLKIKEAKDKGYDTLPQMISDLESLRQQILPAYLNDKASINKLVEEAYIRSQKDIHLAHIFINYTQPGLVDSSASRLKLNAVLYHLKSNEDFAEVARQFSDDPSAKLNGGDLGYITVFTLPYALENLAYSTPPGKISQVYASKTGYHLFKNLGERKDPGTIKAEQILLAFPPSADKETKERVHKLADSLYNRLQKGDDFGKLAAQFSNDVLSASANGQMQEISVGQYDPVFENALFQLPTNGGISKPFLTSYGYHIVKRTGKSFIVSKNDPKAMQALRDRVLQSDRINTMKMATAQKVLKSDAYHPAAFSQAELWMYSDSVINFQHAGKPVRLSATTPLFQLGDKIVTASDWITFAQTYRYKPDGSGVKPYPQIWDEFMQSTAAEYYQTHLEHFNEEFRQQLNEFKEGNLFFDIMQREVWGPAQSDTVALLKYFEANRSKYKWGKSADAVIFYASDAATAQTFIRQLKKNPASWHELTGNFSEKITADSSRFDLTQLPNPAHQVLKAGVITSPMTNKADNSVSFAYLLRTYDQPTLRSFSEAKGLVINDYQNSLEKQWITELKKKYPVRVNEGAWKKLISTY